MEDIDVGGLKKVSFFAISGRWLGKIQIHQQSKFEIATGIGLFLS